MDALFEVHLAYCGQAVVFEQVYQQAVVLKLMPMNNATGITDAERALIGRWFEAGAPVR